MLFHQKLFKCLVVFKKWGLNEIWKWIVLLSAIIKNGYYNIIEVWLKSKTFIVKRGYNGLKGTNAIMQAVIFEWFKSTSKEIAL